MASASALASAMAGANSGATKAGCVRLQTLTMCTVALHVLARPMARRTAVAAVSDPSVPTTIDWNTATPSPGVVTESICAGDSIAGQGGATRKVAIDVGGTCTG